MKKLLVLGALALSLVTTADARPMPTENSSWKTLDRSSRVQFEFPQFRLSYGFFITAPGVCVDGDILRSKKAVKKCVEYGGGRNSDCIKYKMVTPSAAMSGTQTVCSEYRGGRDGDCIEYTEVPYSIATEYEIDVRMPNFGRDRDEHARVLFTKNLTLSTCN